jgi:hypothetical protein
MSQGDSLCSYHKQAKMLFFIFPSTKLENRSAEQVLQWGEGSVGGVGTSGREEVVGKVY